MASSLGDLCSCADASLPQWQCPTHGSVDPALVAAADDEAIEADMALGAAFLANCKRVTFGSIAWEQIPEQTLCICAHPKAVHRRDPAPNVYHCVPQIGKAAPCRCPGFHDVDHSMPRDAFAERLLHEVPEYAELKDRLIDVVTKRRTNKSEHSNPNARARTALLWAWKQSGLDLHEPRTWALWMHESKRVWKAWRDAGSPITAFGKETSFGVASIPALEDR